MNAQTTIPSNIAAIIEQKELALLAKHEAEQKQKQEERNAQIALGTEKLHKIIADTLNLVPEWLHPYDVTEKAFDEDDLARLGRGSEPNTKQLDFIVPGLAPIQFQWVQVRGTENFVGQWRSAQAYNQWREYGPAVPRLEFTQNSYWRNDLEFILVEAKEEFEEFELNTTEFVKQRAEETLRTEEQQKREEEADARRAADQLERESEELELFNFFKNDPIAVHLLKAFVLLRDERSTFEQRLYEADETMYSIEARWSRRAEELRRQADEAERRAEEEKYRLQSDLDDAEAKLKKAQRGW